MAELSAVIGFSALQNNDKVGLILFTDVVELYIPPQKGRQHLLRIIRELLYFTPKGQKTDIRVPLEYLTHVARKRCITFVFSDFIAPTYEDTLKLASRRHDIIGVRIFDPAEASLPNAGLVRLRDPESGRTQLADTGDSGFRKETWSAYESAARQFSDQFRRAKCDTISLASGQSYVAALHRFFKSRA